MSNEDKNNLFVNHLQASNKLDYVKSKKNNIICILCSIISDSKEVKSLKIFEDEIAVVSLNLYPYNPGHLMIFPKRHIIDYRDLKDHEVLHISNLIKSSQNLLSDTFQPTGFNIGWNIGKDSGASIEHIHVHIVPRYNNELGFIDIVGKTRIVVVGVSEVFEKLKLVASNYFKQ